jgi:hypothetical protein
VVGAGGGGGTAVGAGAHAAAMMATARTIDAIKTNFFIFSSCEFGVLYAAYLEIIKALAGNHLP